MLHRSRFPLHWQILIALISGTTIAFFLRPKPVSLDDIPLTFSRVDEKTFLLTELPSPVSSQESNTSVNDLSKTGKQGIQIQYTSSKQLKREFPSHYDAIMSLKAESKESVMIKLEKPGIAFYPERSKIGIQLSGNISGKRFSTNLAVEDSSRIPVRYPAWADAWKKYQSQTGFVLSPYAKSMGDLFLRMLKMVTIPLIVTSLISSITGMTNLLKMKKIFLGTSLYFLFTSMLAVLTGIILVNIIHPGLGVIPFIDSEAAQSKIGAGDTLGTVFWKMLISFFPENIFDALAKGEFLSIISISIIFGVFSVLCGHETATYVNKLFDTLFQVTMKITSYIISLAPLGVFFLIFATVSSQGLGIFQTLAWYMLTVFIGLCVHAMITLPMLQWTLTGRNPITYFKQMAPALLTAFSTASSNATLPLTINCVEEKAGIPNEVSSFVLPLGATVNMDGTALYEAVAVLFIAEMTLGVPMSFGQQVIVAVTTLLASIGAAGIPHAGLVMMAIALQAVGLPVEAQGIIIAVDRVLDMCRTTVNVWSDMTSCAVVYKLFGKTDDIQKTLDNSQI